MTFEHLLQRLTEELADENTQAIVLAGSHARGAATRYSDIDLVRYVRILPSEEERYKLRYEGELLFSLHADRIHDERKKLTRPETALWAVPGIKMCRILLDNEGVFAQLQAEAEAFRWDAHMQRLADDFASLQLVNYAEEAHKLMSGLLQQDDSTTLYAAYGMVLGLMRIMCTYKGLFIPTENAYFETLTKHIGIDSTWSYYLRLASGLEEGTPRMRGTAALGLYMKTVELLRPILRSEHAIVVDKTWAIIAASGYNRDLEQ
jgi:predicted nucleotidyltransferase